MKNCIGITKDLRFCRRPKSTQFYCHLHKRQPFYFLVTAIVAIALSYVAGLIPVPWKTERPKPQIVLSSDRIDLGSGTKKTINNFSARNIGEVDLYQVTVKLQLNSTTLSVTNDDIQVEMIDVPKNMEMPIPIPGDPLRQVIAADQCSVVPGLDTAHHEALWIIIDHLPPKTPAYFRIKNVSFKTLPPGEHCLLVSVPFYTNTLPANFMFNDGSPGFMTPSSGSIGMKSMGPGKIHVLVSMHAAQIDGADIVTNAARLIMAGNMDEAERELTRAIQKNPSLGIAYDNRAALLLMKGRIQEAYQDSLKAISLLPDEPLAHVHVAQCLRLLKRQDEALTNYSKAILLAGTNEPSLIYERGVLLNELNRPVEARRDLDQAILLGFSTEWVCYTKGIAFLKENSISNAIAEFNAAIAMRSDMAEAYLARSTAYRALNQIDMADRDLNEAIRLRPSLAETLKTK
jgi:Flp pilus assembly protein TadD